ncbi:MAG: SAM-dependent methyltransferase [Clostridia bacterium]|nr:SAM-dependent methyltransferase [Clostridia bacterium]
MTNITDKNVELLCRLIEDSARAEVLKKVVFSKPADGEILKAVLTLKSIAGETLLQIESFHTDNKAKHKNIKIGESLPIVELAECFSQINLLTTAGDCEFKRSKSGNTVLLGGGKLEKALSSDLSGQIQAFKRIVPTSNNKNKNYILKGDEPFLKLLEVSDRNGRVYDKKQAKFRQINRFLELIRDVEHALPKEGVLRICDLCCGKSYLSFAVYHYFAVIKEREVKMTGVDLKADVIEYCRGVADALGFDGLEFLCDDVNLYDTDDQVNMVISLHACDVATDMVIGKAIGWESDVILSTPCCHHEMNRLLSCDALSFVSDYSMLRQKLCDAATDALRLKLMEANGYETAALELIDPEETPKNIMLRGIKRRGFDKNSEKAKSAIEEYRKAYTFLTGLENNKWEVF